jgi:hypothetical protein
MGRDQRLADEEASVKTAVGRHAQGMRETVPATVSVLDARG